MAWGLDRHSAVNGCVSAGISFISFFPLYPPNIRLEPSICPFQCHKPRLVLPPSQPGWRASRHHDAAGPADRQRGTMAAAAFGATQSGHHLPLYIHLCTPGGSGGWWQKSSITSRLVRCAWCPIQMQYTQSQPATPHTTHHTLHTRLEMLIMVVYPCHEVPCQAMLMPPPPSSLASLTRLLSYLLKRLVVQTDRRKIYFPSSPSLSSSAPVSVFCLLKGP
ncbi:hypothetical protein IWZ01DRAFT_85945 [Phyllosticta capitalensis]